MSKKQARKQPRKRNKPNSLSSNRAKGQRPNWLEITDETVMMSPALSRALG